MPVISATQEAEAGESLEPGRQRFKQNSHLKKASHTEVCGGEPGEGQQRVGSWGGITWGEMPDIGNRYGDSKSHCHVCTYATILHVLHRYPRT